MKLFFVSVCLLTLAAAAQTGFAAQASREAPPNVVMILADDLGYGDLGCYGQTNYRTPHIDRLAAEGARLMQFNTPAPYCAPTRASLLTGRLPWRCGLPINPHPAEDARINQIDAVHDRAGLPVTEVTLANVLKQAGYATICIGKWHLGHQPEFLPTRRGFDEYFGIPYSNDMRPVHLLENEQVIEYPVALTTLTRRYTERATNFIERNRSKPFFLYFAQMHPHKPLAPGQAFYQQSGTGLYGDTIQELDWSVGQVLAKLKALRLETNTLVIFTSDNGPWFGGSTGNLRGMKGGSFEGGYRVPCIARWPGRIAPGHVNNSLCGIIDLFPTVLTVAGVQPPKGVALDGRNIMPLLTSDAPTPHEALYLMAGRNIAAVRDQRWKLHLLKPATGRLPLPGEKWIDPRGPDGVTILAPYEQYDPTAYPGLRTGDAPKAMMLFDLVADPGEQRDVASENQQTVSRLKRLFEKVEAEMKSAAATRLP